MLIFLQISFFLFFSSWRPWTFLYLLQSLASCVLLHFSLWESELLDQHTKVNYQSYNFLNTTSSNLISSSLPFNSFLISKFLWSLIFTFITALIIFLYPLIFKKNKGELIFVIQLIKCKYNFIF